MSFSFSIGESSFMLLSPSFVFMFFYTAAISSATSPICFILFILTFILFHRRLSSCVSFQNWETAFTSPIFSRNHSSKQSFLSCSVLFYSLSLFRRYCTYKSNIKKPDSDVYTPEESAICYIPGFRQPFISNFVSAF